MDRMLHADQVVPGLQEPGPEFLWPLPYLLAAVVIIVAAGIAERRWKDAGPGRRIRWLAVTAVAGVAILAGSNLGLFVRQLSWQTSCTYCRAFEFVADPSLLWWGLAWAVLAAILAATYVVWFRSLAPRPASRRWAIGLIAAVVGAFAVVVSALTLTSSGAVSMDAAMTVGRGFVTLGFLILYIVGTHLVAFVGGWGHAGRIAALAYGTVAMTVALISVAGSLGPPPALL